MKSIIIVGAAKGADLVIKYFKENKDWAIPGESIKIVGMIDDYKKDARLNVPVIGDLSYAETVDREKYAFCISSSSMQFRRSFYEKYKNSFEFINILRSYPEPSSKIGTSNIIFPNVIVDWFASIGNNNVISTNCIINHHNKIGDGNLLGPGCLLSGSVTIGDNCTLGSGIVIEPGVTLGDNVDIASGTVITGDIPNNSSIKSMLDMQNINVFQGNRRVSKKKLENM